MATKNERKGGGSEISTATANVRTSIAVYKKALREAGLRPEDMVLLRELAEMNAQEFSHSQETIRPARVFL